MKILDDYRQCTGCGACRNICPVDAIILEEGYHTFRYPHIDADKCINCHKCQTVCPVNHYQNDNTLQPTLIAAQADDSIRVASSSGGCFTVIAEYILQKGGYVYGTELDNNFQAHFIRIENEYDLSRCRGSKYVQSDTELTFRDVKKNLEQGKIIAYFGCPCQIVGLKNFLGKQYDNLYTIDILCHGVPSQKLFDLYLMDQKKKGEIQSVHFRDKAVGWRADVITINYKNVPSYSRSWKDGDEYEVGFQTNLILRDSCENCIFCTFPRVGDISIGDFWGIQNYMPVDSKGTSLIFINNPSGHALLDNVKSQFPLWQPMDIPVTNIKNRIFKNYVHHSNKELFFDYLKERTFSESVRRAAAGKFDIGIVGIPTVDNFGGALTYAGLYYSIKEMGYTCMMIERPMSSIHPPADPATIYHLSPYRNDELVMNMPNRETMRSLAEKVDKFLVGSDQLFHRNLLNNFSNFQLLDWVPDYKIKLAYAASFGDDSFSDIEEKRAEVSYYLKKFDAFSVRENSAVNLAKTNFGLDAVQVLDPIFLCNPTIYDSMVQHTQKVFPNQYIGAYILDPTPEKAQLLKKVSQDLQLPLQVFSEMFYDNTNIKKKWDLDIETGKIEDRLACIRNCEYFITDSFHGMCFAIIFKKKFLVLKNTKRGASRFISLASQLQLSGHLININDSYDVVSLIKDNINYDTVYSILNSEISRGKDWLSTQLKTTNKKSFSTEDILRDYFFKQNLILKDQLRRIGKLLRLNYISTNNIYDYIKFIDQLKEDLLIIISAKDTPGMSISPELYSQLNVLGIKADLMNAHWCGYIAVIFRGFVIYESCRYEQKVEYHLKHDKLDISVISAPLHHGNVSHNIINGKDYSVNSRGLNFTIYDFISNTVTDSVGFDTHHRLLTALRNS